MNESHLRNVIEAALLAAGKPLQPAELAELFEENVRPSLNEVRALLAKLAESYGDRGIELKETAAGYRIQVRRELANEISRLWPERPARYSRALLETLALIAYRQPITRAEIEAVRGVAVNPNIIKTVIERNWVRVVGHRDVPGRPELLGTTRDFLDYFGLKNLDELPPLAELKALDDIKVQFELPDGLENPAAGQPDPAVAGAQASDPLVTDVAAAAGAVELCGEEVSDSEDSAEEDSADEDELSASGRTSSELVAGPRYLDE
ncbi:MAG: SMC-Scp complex subunit ScpB [Sinobacteraceae bacterium]|nr:SMC-Scp complex subunit ScpB [Nevskiaceae bacterium]MBV8853522.1 SMC-Scp complex subunit ScpB [Nevskiaceae bacterium]